MAKKDKTNSYQVEKFFVLVIGRVKAPERAARTLKSIDEFY